VRRRRRARGHPPLQFGEARGELLALGHGLVVLGGEQLQFMLDARQIGLRLAGLRRGGCEIALEPADAVLQAGALALQSPLACHGSKPSRTSASSCTASQN